ncbi:hypothetical protein FOCC_FOCC000470 [Frankliniella occidentalis]|nr:hypothetical protein FOCC_FOCC000470 [Frankliniella occidentalis]
MFDLPHLFVDILNYNSILTIPQEHLKSLRDNNRMTPASRYEQQMSDILADWNPGISADTADEQEDSTDGKEMDDEDSTEGDEVDDEQEDSTDGKEMDDEDSTEGEAKYGEAEAEAKLSNLAFFAATAARASLVAFLLPSGCSAGLADLELFPLEILRFQSTYCENLQ